ncbi:MAG: hypothetical protein JSS75_06850 [Bacteroidetes bacterium]|nr:hypothetical protein [Bacteroidota bacterium]
MIGYPCTSRRSVVLLCAFAIFFIAHSIAEAQTPRAFSYQGVIATSTGQPVSDGEHVVAVSIYRDSVGGTPVFSEAYPTRTHGGLFSLLIGGKNGIPNSVLFDVPMYVGVSIDGSAEVQPRTALLAAPYAMHADVAQVANGLTPDATGVVTSINEISGAIHFVGDSSIVITQDHNLISFHARAGGSGGIAGVSALDKSVLVQNPNGPVAGVRVADGGITTTNIADGAVTPSKLNQAGATTGQVLKWSGTKWLPANDSGSAYSAGNGITITGSSIAVSKPLPSGTLVNSTLRWDGAQWVENTNLTSNPQGFTTVNNSLVLASAGNASELRFYEPVGNGTNYSSFKAGSQTGDIIYTLPTSLPGTSGFLRVDNTGAMSWAPSTSSAVTFDQVQTGINQGQTLTVANGSSLLVGGTGIIEANHFVGQGSVTNSVDLGTSEVAGILPIANGGTNSGTALAGNRMMVSNGGAIVEFNAGTAGQVLTSNGASMPTWTTITTLPTGTANNTTLRWNAATTQWLENTNVLSTAAGQVSVNAGLALNGTGSPVLANGVAGTSGQVLTSAGANATPIWSTIATLPTGTTTNSTLRWNGSTWVENANVLESASGLVTANAGANLAGTASPMLLNNAAGTSGQVLTSAGAGATPTWTTINTLPSGTTTNSTMRWSGTSWVENTNVLETSAGQVSANAGVNLSGSASPLLLNNAAGTSGQILTSAGAGATPTWSTVNLLPTGTTTNSTLRWSGSAWVENANVLETSAGQVSAVAGVNLSGTSAPMLLNNAAGTSGQVLTSAGTGATPTWTTINALPAGTTTNSTLRWNGTAWVEDGNVLETSAGQVSASAGVNLSGTAAPMLLNNAAGTSGQVLTSAGTGATPTWTTISVLPTGTTTNSTLRWNGTSWVENTNVLETSAGQVSANAGVNLSGTTSPLLLNNAAGTSGQVLTSAGTGSTPTWTTVNLLPTGTATNSTLRWNGTGWVENTNVLATSAGQVTVNAGANLSGTASPLLLNNAAGTSGQVLTSAGAGATPTWTTVNLLANGTTTNSTLRWNGTAWVENTNVLSTAAGQVSANGGVDLSGTSSPMLLNNAAGTSGQVLTSAGAGSTPTWSTVNLLPNGTTTNSTLRWNGTAWVENTNVLASSAGLVTVNAGVNLSGTSSPMLLNNLAGTSGQVLTSAGTGATPTWTTINLLPTGTTTNSTLRWNGTAWVENTNVLASSAGLVTANAGVNLGGTAAPLLVNNSAGTSGQILTSAGAGATPTWTTLGTIPTGTTTNSTLRWNGTTWVENTNVLASAGGQVTVNSGINLAATGSPLLANNSAGTNGQVLVSAGAGATPAWTTLSLLPNGSTTNSTLRYDGSQWVENTSILATASGQLTVNSGLVLNGSASPIVLNGGSGTSGQFLASNGSGMTPSWVSGNLIASGTATDNTLRWNGSSWVESANVKSSSNGQVTVNAGVNLNGTASPLLVNGGGGTSGQVLTSAGSVSTPTWTTLQTLPSGSLNNSTLRWNGTSWIENTNVLSSSSGQVTVQAGVNFAGTASPLQLAGSAGTSGQFLMSQGVSSTPTWATGTLVAGGTTVDNTLRWSGTAWVETSNVKSSSAGQLTVNAGVNLSGTASPMLLSGAAGTSGQVLISQGAGATPAWATGTLLPTGSATDNTLRWNGTSWVESAAVKSSAAGLVTVNAGVNLNSTASPLLANGSAGTSGQVLTSAGAGATPTWSSIGSVAAGTQTNSTLRWSGTSWVENTNVTATAAGLVSVAAGQNFSGTTSPLLLNNAAGTSGQFLASAGAGATPTWVTGNLIASGTSIDNTLRWNGTSWVESSAVKSSAGGQLTVNAGVAFAGTASPVSLNGSVGTSGQVLTSAGAGATPTWTTLATLTAGTATDNTLRWSGTAWVESANVKSSAAGQVTANAGVNLNGTTSPLLANGSAGTNGYVLSSLGTGNTPQWTDPNTLLSAWKLTGNSGTTPGTAANQNYLGTSDAKDFVLATNAAEHLRISSSSTTIASTTTGIIHTRSVLPGGGSGLMTGMTVETMLPSSATASGFAVGGLFANSTLNNSFVMSSSDVYCGLNGTVSLTGTAGTNVVRANDGVIVVNHSTAGLTHGSLIGQYGTVRTAGSTGTTVTNASALRSDFDMRNASSVFTNAYGLYVENPVLGASVPSSAIGTFNGVYVENLTNGTTKRAFVYDGSGTNAPVAITSAGQVGIGRKDPTQALEVYNGNVLISNNTNSAGSIALEEPSGSGTNVSKFVAQAQTADIVYTLPSAQPTANQVLTASSVSGAGPYAVTLAWSTPAGAGSGWSTTGNSGTTAGTNFLGTTDNVAMDIRVNNLRVMEYQPNATSANIVGGYSGNSVTGSAVGAVIAGGGSASGANNVSDNYGFIGGGTGNLAGNSGAGKTYATIVGGLTNTASGQYSFIGAGASNLASSSYATVGGGLGNAVSTSGYYGVVAGGHNNFASSASSAIVGGETDSATGQYSFIGAGQHNVALGQYSVIAGGAGNTLSSAAGYGVIGGGQSNVADSQYAVIPGGQNLKLGNFSFGVNMGTAADIRGLSKVAYFGNMNLLVNNTDGTARKIGVNTNSPATGVDVNGDVSLRQTGFSANNGNNNDISIGGMSFVRISGPTAAFTITGIAGGVDGKMVILFNSTSQTMTVSHQDVASTTAADRILCKATNNVSVGQYGVVTLIYSTNESRWVVVSTN